MKLELENIHKSFTDAAGRRVAVLHGVDLAVDPGESFVLLGPSGCGKTTLLRIVAGLERPDAGRVAIDGRDVTGLAPERRPTAMVFQNYALFPHLTVAGNVGFGLKIRQRPAGEIRRRVDEMLELVQLAGLGGRRVGELSGGQQQRVALARVLAVEPQILLLDEPLSNLDAALRRETRAVIRRLQTDLGLTMIYITHDQDEGLALADRLALMRDGRIVQAGAPRELLARPATVEAARFLGQRNLIRASVRGMDAEYIGMDAGCICLALSEVASEAPAGDTAVDVVHVPASGWMGEGKPREGNPVWLAALPDELTFNCVDAHDEVDSGWPGEVTMTSATGAGLECEVRLTATGELLRVLQPWPGPDEEASRPEPRRGDIVRLKIRHGAGLIYPRGME